MEDLIYQALIHGDHVVAWVVAALAAFAIKYVLGRIGSERVRSYVERAAREVFNAVEEVWQTYVSALKEANSDGKLTREEKFGARSKAIAIAKANLGKKGLARLVRILGIDPSDLDGWLGTKVESSVNALKLAGKAAGGGRKIGELVDAGDPSPLP